MKDNNHQFKLVENKDYKIYSVKCLNTGGDFNTSIWRCGFIKNKICPCCGLEIK